MLENKLNALQAEEIHLQDNIRRAHDMEDDDDTDVMLNWDEQRDFEYLYDRMDLTAALQTILTEDGIDRVTRVAMLDTLMNDIREVIDERTQDIRKATAVIDDMNELAEACRHAQESLS